MAASATVQGMNKKTNKTKMPHVSQDLVKKAIRALLKHHASTRNQKNDLLGNDLQVQVQLGLETAPVHTSAKPTPIRLPHPLYQVQNSAEGDLEEASVCLIVKDESKPTIQALLKKVGLYKGEQALVKKVLTLSSLRSKHASFAQRRALMAQYTHFLADDRILPMLTKALGKDFLKYKRQPVPVRVTRHESLPFKIQHALSTTTVVLGHGTCVTVKAGFTNMSADQLVANCAAIMEAVPSMVIPRGWINVRSMAVKTSASTALPVYNKTPEELQQLAIDAGILPVYREGVQNTSDSRKPSQPMTPPARKKAKKSPLAQAAKALQRMEKEKSTSHEAEKSEKKQKKRTTEKTDEEASPAKKARKEDKKSARTEATSEPKADKKSGMKSKSGFKTEPKADKKESQKETEAEKVDKKKGDTDADFAAAKKFTGSRTGFVFKKGPKGLGYYKDVPPVVDRLAMEALSRLAKGSKGGKKEGGGKRRR